MSAIAHANCLLMPETAGAVIERAFGAYDLISSTISPLLIMVETFRYVPLRMTLLTRAAPLMLITPEECIGGMQFSYLKKRFVYRFDNCVLSFVVKRIDSQDGGPWLSTGTLYLAPTVDEARDLVRKLIQSLPGERKQSQFWNVLVRPRVMEPSYD